MNGRNISKELSLEDLLETLKQPNNFSSTFYDVMDNLTSSSGYSYPLNTGSSKRDVLLTEKGYINIINLPGVDASMINIMLVDNYKIKISYTVKRLTDLGGLLTEAKALSLFRDSFIVESDSFILEIPEDYNLDITQIKTVAENGILAIFIPRIESQLKSSPVNIEINNYKYNGNKNGGIKENVGSSSTL